MKTSKLSLLICIYSFSILCGQTSIDEFLNLSKQLVRRSLEDRKGYYWLKELCEIGPRLVASSNSYNAIEWARKKMIESGFDSVWLQPVRVPVWIRGDREECQIIKSKEYSGKKLNITALGGSIGTGDNGVSGRVVVVHDFMELYTKRDKVKGNFVFFNRSLDFGEVETFSAYGKAVDQRIYGAIEAAKYGAVGVIVRSITTKHDNTPHTGILRYNDSIPRIPAVVIGNLDADFLVNAIKVEPNLELYIKLSCKSLDDTISYNVIGEIRGCELPNEVVLVGGHIDSWDKGCGAHDNGTGVIHSMEALDLIKRLNFNPKRTIRCVLFMGEEFNSIGGIEYNNYAQSTEQIHIAAIESDRGGFTPRGFSVEADSNIILDLQKFLPYLSLAKIDWIRKGGSGADISRLKNVKAKIGFVPDNQRYMDVHHSDNDIFEEVHPRELQLGSAAIAILALLISQFGL